MIRLPMPRVRLAPALVIATLLISPLPVSAQIAVFDPTNYVQNLQTAANTLRQIEHQITSLQNQAQMLLNQARQLTSLPTTLLNDIDQNFTQTLNLLRQAERVAYDVQSIEQAMSKYQNFNGAQTNQQLISGARERWQNSLLAFQHSLGVGATAVNNLPSTQAQTDTLVSASQAAVGVLQAGQAGNQLLAVQTRQLSDLTAIVAAQNRAQALEMARQGAAEDQAREQVRRFLTGGQGYQPQTVTMFR
jgi:P-type conjugative transfer protein TrbJ